MMKNQITAIIHYMKESLKSILDIDLQKSKITELQKGLMKKYSL